MWFKKIYWRIKLWWKKRKEKHLEDKYIYEE